MDRAISPFEAQDLLEKVGVNNIGNIDLTRLQRIMDTMKSDITGMKQNGFTSRKAMVITDSYEYYWAHNTAPGIIWLWAQQDADTRAQWINEPKSKWENFVPKEPSPDAPLYGFTPSVSTSPSASRASVGSTLGTGAVSVPASYATSSSFLSRLEPSSSSTPPTSSPFSFGSSPDSGPVSVPTTPQASSSQTSSGGYRKRRTRKTRRKSNRRGKSRSQSRSRQIRRKKTHHRRHRR